MATTEIQVGMPARQYHRADFLSSTMLRNFLASVQLAEYRKTAPIESKALTMGEAIHTAILEPERFQRDYAMVDARKGSKAWTGFQQANPRKVLLNPTDYSTCVLSQESVKQHPTASRFLRDSSPDEREVSVFGHDNATNVSTKCRCDILTGDEIVDIKTTTDADPENFARSISKYGYHIQAAYYQMIVEQHTGHRLPFYFVAVEKSAPNLVGVYELDDDSMEQGRRMARKGLQLYAESRNNETTKPNYEGYGVGVKTLRLPPWKLDNESEANDE